MPLSGLLGDKGRQEIMSRIDKLESPRAREVLSRLASGVYLGQLAPEDMSVLGAVAERLAGQAKRVDSSLTSEEWNLVEKYRHMTEQQREGLMLLISAFMDLPKVGEGVDG